MKRKNVRPFSAVLNNNSRAPLIVWGMILVFACFKKITRGKFNNYDIFERSWDHFVQHQDLYAYYPAEYHDRFLYGPLFSLFIAPFSMMPPVVGVVLWLVVSTAMLLYAVKKIPGLSSSHQAVLFWLTANELLLALLMEQYNILIAAFLVLSYLFTEKEKPWVATFFIALGFLTKIYGIAGLCFWLFSKQKKSFIFSFVCWTLLLGLLPMIGGWEYGVEQYRNWFDALGGKNTENMFALMQNMGLVGMARKLSGSELYSDMLVVIPGIVLFLLPLLRRQAYSSALFRRSILASMLLFIVLFSSGTESNTYIIAYLGIALWWLGRDPNSWYRCFDIFLLVGAVIFSFTTSDLMPKVLKEEILLPYALKALFPTLIWLRLQFSLLFSSKYSEDKTMVAA
ncbi:MAG: glycosyltransferase family 87 protein [Porphyromonas sp.]|nr:glycosyltransferase family 87 protein [Porphyromonas sp.]